MHYLDAFKARLAEGNAAACFQLWEEYCQQQEMPAEELIAVLEAIKSSALAQPFGNEVEKILPRWQKLSATDQAYRILQLVVDLQTTNREELRLLALEQLSRSHRDSAHFQEKMRLIGLRDRDDFQGAISHFQLLEHAQPGNFVLHTSGWRVAKIVEVSLLREQLTVEFEDCPGPCDIAFEHACKILVALPSSHFLALRFHAPDLLAKEAKSDPVALIRRLLQDLGPKTISEIKRELCNTIIPEQGWSKWWQFARARLKKEPQILLSGEHNRLSLLPAAFSQQQHLEQELSKVSQVKPLLRTVHRWRQDGQRFDRHLLQLLAAKIDHFLAIETLPISQKIELHFLREQLQLAPFPTAMIDPLAAIPQIIEQMEILPFRKQLLLLLRQRNSAWQRIYLDVLFTTQNAPLRQFLFSTVQGEADCRLELQRRLQQLCAQPTSNPKMLLWYLQKIIVHDDLPLADGQGYSRFFEAFLLLLQKIEKDPKKREISSKMQRMLTHNRYSMVRKIIAKADLASASEFLLLAAKCQSLSNHNQKILHSLIRVAHPSIAVSEQQQEEEEEIIWTTRAGYEKMKRRIEQLATVETIANAREIETARAHGDLRENAEFKAALEKRQRLQSELQLCSTQFNQARILNAADIITDRVSVGTRVRCHSQRGEVRAYTLLGPWDAEPEKNILSFHSKLAQSIAGCRIGDTFTFQEEQYTIEAIENALAETISG